jgi:hypothetical protein
LKPLVSSKFSLQSHVNSTSSPSAQRPCRAGPHGPQLPGCLPGSPGHVLRSQDPGRRRSGAVELESGPSWIYLDLAGSLASSPPGNILEHGAFSSMIEVKMVICIAVVLMFPTIPIRMLGIRALAQRCNKDGDSRWQQPWEPRAIRRQRTRLGKCCLASAGAAGECGGWKVAGQIKLQTYSKS